VYTRKSTEEGLEQKFNSMDAQREAAEAYVLSQRQQGWALVAERYDDGGFSGGNLDRPGLQRLLTDIAAGRIDCVVVYKVDRLSRSLLDFARLIDQFEQRGVSFVAVTQQFNTTTSLGRLTLNVLLSFAQFEREIIGERTRDKMAAARKKGKWIGGLPVLGYDVAAEGGRLVVNETEAAQVREIFRLYQERGSLAAVVKELDRRQWKTKKWRSRRGLTHGGRVFQEPMLLRLLTNPIYIGQVKHKGQLYSGEQPAIIDGTTWERVNAHRQNGAGIADRANGQTHRRAPLEGLLYCAHSQQRMGTTSTAHGGRQYRYYVCRRGRCPAKAVSASVIEESVKAEVRLVLGGKEDRQQLGITDQDWHAFEAGDGALLLHTLVRQIRYEGVTGRVQLDLTTPAIP
jgi:site-specific DNA recombinase